jgi:hypothetical protein
MRNASYEYQDSTFLNLTFLPCALGRPALKRNDWENRYAKN